MSPDQHRPSTHRTRRQFLAKGGVAFATSLSTLTAGCLSSLPPLGHNQRYGRVDVPSPGEPTYRKWLPAPSSIDQPIERFHFVALNSTRSRPEAPELFVARRSHIKASIDHFGIGFENYDQLVDSSFGTAIEASFDRTSVVETIAESGYDQVDEYRGYTVFARSDIPRRVAVGDGVLVWTSAYQHDYPHLQAVIDAGAGKRPLYHEENTAFERLTTTVGGNPYTGVNTAIHDPTGRPVMLSDAFRFDEDTAYQVVQYHYQTDRVPTKQELETALKTDDYRFADEGQALDVQINGQLATVETRVPLRSGSKIDPRYDLPQVTWGASHKMDVNRLTFRHEIGEPVPARRLFYDIDRPSAPGKIEKQSLWTGAHTVEAGANATVDLREYPNATDVNLVYSTGDTDYYVLFGLAVRGEIND